MDLFAYDRAEGVELLCGVDEAGRGPLAGDVYAGACILPPDAYLEGLNDSKKLTSKRREALYDTIREKAAAYAVGVATVEEIERLNILNATFLAMQRAVDGLSICPRLALVDGNRNPRLHDASGRAMHARCVVGGDAKSASIAAASILAKVERDRYMERVAQEYPQYQFEVHKGYGTALHYQLLDQFGPSPVHRLSFLKKYAEERRGSTSAAHLGGLLGEEAARDWLREHGYQMETYNYHSTYGEIDIVARKDSLLVFCEVKTRTEGALAEPRDAVTRSKQRKLVKTALCWMGESPCIGLTPRFDVIEVELSPIFPQEVRSIRCTENAFGADVLDGMDPFTR